MGYQMKSYKKFIATAASATLVASAIVPVASASFTDVEETHEFASYINAAVEAGYVKGYADGTFGINDHLKRSQVVIIIGRYLEKLGYTSEATTSPWSDVTDEEVIKYGNIVKDAGVFTGYADGTLNGAGLITRENMAVVLDRLAKTVTGTSLSEVAKEIEDVKVADLATANAAYQESIQALRDLEISTADNFNPKGNLKRGQFAKFIITAVEKIDAIAPTFESIAKQIEAVDATLPAVEDITADNAEAAKAAVEAAKTSIAAIEAKMEKAELTEEEVAELEKAIEAVEAKYAPIIEAADKALAPTEKMEVEYVSAINETSIEVTLKDATEEDLVDATLTLTDAEGNELTAIYSEKSLDKDGKATFTLAADQKLVDTTEYTVTGEKFSETTFIAKIGGSKVAEFVKVTEAIPATLRDNNGVVINAKNVAKVKFAAKDQYGEEIAVPTANVKVEGTLNGMLLTATELKIDTTNKDEIVIERVLNQDDQLVINVVLTDAAGKELAKSTLEYVIVKGEKAEVTTLELKTADNKTSVPSGESIVFTASAFDQFKSPVKIDSTNTVRWVVNGKEAATFGTVSNETFTLTATTPGEYKVQVFAENNSKVVAEKTVTIGAAELKTVTYTNSIPADLEGVKLSTDLYNNEELVLGTVTPNTGAALLASNLKFNVTAMNSSVSASDITVVAEEVKDKNGEKVIVVKAKTTKAGSFQVTPYVGDSFTAEKVVKGNAFTVTTSINPTVATIGDVAFDAAELKVGQDVYKEVVITNKHGEVLTQAQAGVSVTSSNANVTASIVQGDKNIAGQDEKKTYLKVNAAAAETAVITLQKDEVVKTVTVKFATPTLTTIKVADSKISDVVAGDQEAGKYALTKVSYLDQDGKEMDVTSNATIAVKDSKGQVLTTTSDLVEFTAAKEENGKLVIDATPGAKQEYLKVAPKANVAKGTYTVELTSAVTVGTETKNVTTSFKVVVGEARAAKTVEVTAKSTAVTVGGTTELTIVPKDQYGEFILVNNNGGNAPEFNITGDEFVTLTQSDVKAIDKDGKETTEAAKTVAYKVVVTGAKIGTGTVKVEVLGAEANGTKPVLATASQTITVDSVGHLVNEVIVTETELQNTNASEQTVVLEAVGKDAAGNKVAINAQDLTWSVKSVKGAKGEVLTVEGDLSTGATLKNAEGKYLQNNGTYGSGDDATIKLVDNKLTGSQGITADVELEVVTANNKKATTVVKFDATGSKYVSGLAVHDAVFNVPNGTATTVAAKDLTDNGLKIAFTADQVDATTGTVGDIVLTFTGVDQYGKPMVDANNKGAVVVTATSDNRAAVTVTETTASSTITLKAMGEGVATVYVKVGNETIAIEVTVSKEVAENI